MLEKLKEQAKGFTKLIWCDTYEGFKYFIMVKYGPNLKQMLRKCKAKRFSIKTALQIGMQIVERLQTLHEVGCLHLDLKPDNILLMTSNRTKPESSTLLLIDYGLCRRYKD